MPRLKAAIDIEAPREHVFALAADLVKRPEWTTFVHEVTITSGDGKSPGATDKTVARIGPRKNRWDGMLTEYQPGETMARKFSGYLEGEERMVFQPSNGGTRVEWSVNYTPPFGLLGKIGAWVFMARVYLNELEGSLENLKKALEA
jgi:uncharacterized membrane protein